MLNATDEYLVLITISQSLTIIMYVRRTNHHDGNKRYRTMVEKRKVDYVNSKRLDKPLVALDIIREWRNQKPPGRFLKLDEKTDLWFDVGDKKAREKTSQALREKAPLLRKQQEEQIQEMNDSDLAVESDDQTTEVCTFIFSYGIHASMQHFIDTTFHSTTLCITTLDEKYPFQFTASNRKTE